MDKGLIPFASILGFGILLVLLSGFIKELQDLTMIIVAVMFLVAGIVSTLISGMKVNKIICRTMILSAALIGAAGALRVSSVESLSTSITNDVGWTGIIVAWLAKLNPIGIVIVTALISVLQCGCIIASVSASSVDSHFADLLQGIILFIILAADFFIRFKIVIRKNNKEAS